MNAKILLLELQSTIDRTKEYVFGYLRVVGQISLT